MTKVLIFDDGDSTITCLDCIYANEDGDSYHLEGCTSISKYKKVDAGCTKVDASQDFEELLRNVSARFI